MDQLRHPLVASSDIMSDQLNFMIRFTSCISLLIIALSSCAARHYAKLTFGDALIKHVREVRGDRFYNGYFTSQTMGHPFLESRKGTADEIAAFWREIEKQSIENWLDKYFVENDDESRYSTLMPYCEWKLEIRSPMLNVVKEGGGYYPADNDARSLSPSQSKRFTRMTFIFNSTCRLEK